MRVVVKAGEIYRADARRGARYLRIEQVRSPVNSPYVLCREVSASGRLLTGWLHGVDRGRTFAVQLTRQGQTWTMPARYSLVPEEVRVVG